MTVSSGIRVAVLLAAALIISACGLTPKRNIDTAINSGNAYLVVIDDPRAERRRLGISGPGYDARLNYDSDPALNRQAAAIANDHQLVLLNQWPLRNLGVHCFVVDNPTKEQLSELRNDKRVKWVQTFNEFEVQTGKQTAAPGYSADSIRQSFESDVDARGAGIRIAVIDTGVDYKHPDLQDSALQTQNFAGSRGTTLEEAHGTAVVGIIAANARSSNGVNGLARDAEVHLLRGCWQNESGKGVCNTLTLALALDAAIDLTPDVLNLSLSGRHDRVLQKSIELLTNNGTLVVAAYDENRAPKTRFPAPLPGVIYAFGNAANTQPGTTSSQVMYAPSQAICLTPMAGYDLVSGHSIAAPQLTSMLACLLDENPAQSTDQVVDRLAKWLENYFMLESESDVNAGSS